MSSEQKVETNKRYYTVIDGTFRVQVPAEDPEAVVREWSTKDGKSGTKYERHVRALFGTVHGLSIEDGTYGKSLNIYLDENEEGQIPVISLSADSRYGEDALKKLPELQAGVQYRFLPYSFTPKGEDKEKRGLSIASADDEGEYTVKVPNHFWDTTGEGKPANGYPEATKEDKSDWPFYYKKANKFMVAYAVEHVLPKFTDIPKSETTSVEGDPRQDNYPVNEVRPEDIPFD